MSFRNDLAAAQSRADSAMRELADLKDARSDDQERLAKLERALANSMQELATLREQQPSSERESADSAMRERPVPAPATLKPPATSGSISPVFAAMGASSLLVLAILFFLLTPSTRDSSNWSEEEPAIAGGASHLQNSDVSEGIEEARRMATRYFASDIIGPPILVEINARAVDDTGSSQLEYGGVSYHFEGVLTPMQEEPDDAPVGARRKQNETRSCNVQIEMTSEGFKMPDRSHDILGLAQLMNASCGRMALKPRCTFREVKDRARALGAPADSLASISIKSLREQATAPTAPVRFNKDDYCDEVTCLVEPDRPCCQPGFKKSPPARISPPRPGWQVEIVDRGEELFSQLIPDDCASPTGI